MDGSRGTRAARGWYVLLGVLGVSLIACEGGGGKTTSDTSSTGDTGDTFEVADSGPTEVDTSGDTGVVTPAGVWSWVPVVGSRCASGTSTGFGLRRHASSRRLLLYFQGGGACSTGPLCWESRNAANVDGFGPSEFAAEELVSEYALFAQDSANPFRDMHMVFFPYCTGDGHSGTRVVDLVANGEVIPTHFVGRRNLELYLEILTDTFPDLEEVWVVGTSAGGAGATANYARIRDAFDVPVHSIIDSAPGFTEENDLAKWEVWGVEPPCDGCTSGGDIRRYNRSLAPDTRYAFLSFLYDKTTSGGLSPELYRDRMQALLDELEDDPEARSFIVDNSNTRFTTTLHVITTKNRPAALRTAYLRFLTAMVGDSGWVDVTLQAP